MALKKKGSVPTKVLVVDARTSRKGTTPEITPERTPAVPAPTSETTAGTEWRNTTRPARTSERVTSRTPRSSVLKKKVDQPLEPDQETSCWTKPSKQISRRLVDELEEGEPEAEVPPPAFEATFDEGNSPNAGDGTEAEEEESREARSEEQMKEDE